MRYLFIFLLTLFVVAIWSVESNIKTKTKEHADKVCDYRGSRVVIIRYLANDRVLAYNKNINALYVSERIYRFNQLKGCHHVK